MWISLRAWPGVAASVTALGGRVFWLVRKSGYPWRCNWTALAGEVSWLIGKSGDLSSAGGKLVVSYPSAGTVCATSSPSGHQLIPSALSVFFKLSPRPDSPGSFSFFPYIFFPSCLLQTLFRLAVCRVLCRVPWLWPMLEQVCLNRRKEIRTHCGGTCL